jgi:hypothetical protein
MELREPVELCNVQVVLKHFLPSRSVRSVTITCQNKAAFFKFLQQNGHLHVPPAEVLRGVMFTEQIYRLRVIHIINSNL